MARICPLCGEQVEEGGKFPHICKAIPMPTIGQCEECGTALNDLNVSDLYPKLCKECHRKIPGNASEAVKALIARGRLIIVDVQDYTYLRFYVVHNDRVLLDLVRRTWGGRIVLHRGKSYKWSANARESVGKVAKALEPYNPELAREVLRWVHAAAPAARSLIAEDLMERYQGKCLKMDARPAGASR